MSVTYVNGDLLAQDVDGYIHGCNAISVMSSGISLQFKQRFPQNYDHYRKICSWPGVLKGEVISFDENEKRIYNLISQHYTGPDAYLQAIDVGLRWIDFDASVMHPVSSLALPQIGCGIGGLNWEDVQKTIEQVCQESTVEYVVCSL